MWRSVLYTWSRVLQCGLPLARCVAVWCMPDDVAVPGYHSPCVLQRTATHCNVYLQKAVQCGLHLARCVAVCCMPHDDAVPGY